MRACCNHTAVNAFAFLMCVINNLGAAVEFCSAGGAGSVWYHGSLWEVCMYVCCQGLLFYFLLNHYPYCAAVGH